MRAKSKSSVGFDKHTSPKYLFLLAIMELLIFSAGARFFQSKISKVCKFTYYSNI